MDLGGHELAEVAEEGHEVVFGQRAPLPGGPTTCLFERAQAERERLLLATSPFLLDPAFMLGVRGH
jgi:hypothetical protein